MKRILILLILAAAIVLSASPTAAAEPPASGAMLMVLASPQVSTTLRTEAVSSAFMQGAYTQAMQLLPVLNNLKKQGHIASYQLNLPANAVQVQGMDLTAAMLLDKLPQTGRLVPASNASVQAARADFNRALGRARSAAPRIQTPRVKAPAAAAWTNIQIHETWDFVQGHYNVSSSASVQVVLKNSGGTVRETVTTTSDSTGFFFANFRGLLNGDIVATDYVELTVGGADLATVTADNISIDFDYGADHVTGFVAPDRNVRVNLRDQGPGNCGYPENMVEVSSDVTTGAYDANFSGVMDVNSRVEADVLSVQQDEPIDWSSVVWRHAPWVRLELNPDNNGGQGNAILAGDTVTVTLKTGATVKETFSITANTPDAGFGFNFKQSDVLLGDTVYLDEGASNLATIPITNLTSYINPTTNLITGSAPASQPVTISGHHYNRTTGNWDNACQTITTPGTGLYSVNLGKDFVGGDTSDANYVVGTGFELHVYDQAPYIEMYTGGPFLGGGFHMNYNGTVKIVVKSSAGVSKYTGTGYAYGGRWEQILAKAGAPVLLATNDRVTVTPVGGTALNATVVKLTATIDLVNNKISGLGPANKPLALFDQVWRGGGYGCDDCWTNVSASATQAYSFTFKADLVDGDYVQARSVDAAGNETIANGFSTTPTITMSAWPALFRTGRPNNVTYAIDHAVHVQNTFLGWDGVTRPNVQYLISQGPNYNWWPGGSGPYTIECYFGSRGDVYFRGFAYADGRWIFTNPERSVPVR
ncbi:MAG: hypothetical protein WCF84_00235 [Anaerolineae bacterium]